MTIESLAQRIERAADPDRFCTAVAACLERNGGDLEGALELADTILMPQFDEEFERFHPRGDGGRFVEKSKHAKTRHANERARRRAERKPRDTGPKTTSRQAVEAAMNDPELREQLVAIASKVSGRQGLRTQIDPEDIVQAAMARALKESDNLEVTDAHGWLRKKTKETLLDAFKRAKAAKHGRDRPAVSLDSDWEVAGQAAERHGLDPEEVIGKALEVLAQEHPKEARVLSARYGLKRSPKSPRMTPAQRKAAERARAKIAPIIHDLYGAADDAPGPTSRDMEDVPGKPSSEHPMAPGPKRKPAEQRLPQDRQWRKAGVTAAAHEGKVWHRKSPERIAVKKLAKTLKLSPEQTAAIKDIVLKKDYLAGGKADDIPHGDFDSQKVAEGAKVEREHTSDPAKAREIARDHLSEDKAYYDKLKKMEGGKGPTQQFDAGSIANPAFPPRRGLLRRPKPVVVQSVGSVPPAAPDLARPHWEFRATDKAKGRRLGRRKLTDPLSTPRNWITADGEIVPVDATTHWQAAQKAGEESPKQRGWIRTNAGSFEVDSLTPRAVAHILAVMRANPELWQGPGKVAVESKSHDNLFLGPEDLDSDPHALMPERRQPPSTYFDDTPPRGVAIGKTRSASTARVSDKPRQRMSPSWRTPSVAAYNKPPTIKQEEPSWSPELADYARQSGVLLGRFPAVSPSPEASVRHVVSAIGGMRERFPRLGRVSPVILSASSARDRGGMDRGGHKANVAKLLIGLGHHNLRMPLWKKRGRNAPLTLPMRGEHDAETTARHEYGHHLWWHLDDDEAKAWDAAHGEQMANQPEYAQNVSHYATTHPAEGFAEAFAAFTHPDYGSENTPRLPAPIEAYFRRILGQEG